jgi:hypothetical protein
VHSGALGNGGEEVLKPMPNFYAKTTLAFQKWDGHTHTQTDIEKTLLVFLVDTTRKTLSYEFCLSVRDAEEGKTAPPFLVKARRPKIGANEKG